MGKFNSVLEALYAGRNQWTILWITGSDVKELYEPSTEWLGGCICCELLSDKSCSKYCPLNGFAWKSDCRYSDDSFFNNWAESESIKERIFWAGRMVYAFNLAIEYHLTHEDYNG